MEPTIRIELMTSSLPWMRSTIWAMRALFPNNLWSGWWESNPRDQLGRLEFYHWTTPAFNFKYHLYINFMVEGGGFEPPKAEPSDLQSDPFGHSGTPPRKQDIIRKIVSAVNH